jgi:acyl carrier protein
MTERIRKFIQTEIMKDTSGGELGNSDNLIESGIIDSLGIQQLIMFLEKEYKLDIADDDLVPDNFETIDAIDKFISSKR